MLQLQIFDYDLLPKTDADIVRDRVMQFRLYGNQAKFALRKMGQMLAEIKEVLWANSPHLFEQCCESELYIKPIDAHCLIGAWERFGEMDDTEFSNLRITEAAFKRLGDPKLTDKTFEKALSLAQQGVVLNEWVLRDLSRGITPRTLRLGEVVSEGSIQGRVTGGNLADGIVEVDHRPVPITAFSAPYSSDEIPLPAKPSHRLAQSMGTELLLSRVQGLEDLLMEIMPEIRKALPLFQGHQRAGLEDWLERAQEWLEGDEA